MITLLMPMVIDSYSYTYGNRQWHSIIFTLYD